MDSLKRVLYKGPRKLRVQLLVGLYNGHTEAAALRRLLSLQKRFGKYIEVKVAQNARFHWKIYLFENMSRSTAFIGSSNLTRDGLGLEGEFNIRLVSANTTGTLAHIAETFDRLWKKQSVPLSIEIAEGFVPAFSASKDLTRKIDPIIKEILHRPRGNSGKKAPKTPPS